MLDKQFSKSHSKKVKHGEAEACQLPKKKILTKKFFIKYNNNTGASFRAGAAAAGAAGPGPGVLGHSRAGNSLRAGPALKQDQP